MDLEFVYRTLLMFQGNPDTIERVRNHADGANEEITEELDALREAIQKLKDCPPGERNLELMVVRVCALNLKNSFEDIVQEIDELGAVD